MNKRLDIYVANNSDKYGFELTANATKDQLSSHYEDQALIYKKALNLSEIMVINFISAIIRCHCPEWLFISDDPAVTVIHGHLPAIGLIATIIKSVNSENIDLSGTLDDIAQQLPDIRIDEFSCISVVGFVFQLSEYDNMKDLAKALKDQLTTSTDDVSLQFFRKEKDCVIAANKVGSLTQTQNVRRD